MAWKYRMDCIKWDGQERTLPLGYSTQIPGLAPRHFANVYGVLDLKEDDGIRDVFRDMLQPGDIIVEAQINEAAIAAIEKAYGKDWIWFKRPDSGDKITRDEWKKEYLTDPLELEALKDMRKRLKQLR